MMGKELDGSATARAVNVETGPAIPGRAFDIDPRVTLLSLFPSLLRFNEAVGSGGWGVLVDTSHPPHGTD